MARILVMEDARNIRKMVELALRQDGHEVRLAEDGARGLQEFGDGSGWDLVLVDQQMPSATGSEVVAEALRRDPHARLVMMTAFATHELASQVLTAGAMDFLRKPFTAEVLRGAIQAALFHLPEAPANVPASTSPGVAANSSSSSVSPSAGTARTSWRVNGWSFWPVDGAPRPAEAPASLESGQVFQVRSPFGSLSRCFVGATAHVRQQVERQIELQAEQAPNEEGLWESLYAQALLNLLWHKPEAPPAVLPLYEMPPGSPGARGLVWWGPFAG